MASGLLETLRCKNNELDICDRCANMKVEELKPVMIDGQTEHWCAQCLALFGAFSGVNENNQLTSE